MASAARKDFERFDRLESASSRFFVSESSRIESVSVTGVLARLYTFSHSGARRALTCRTRYTGGDQRPKMTIGIVVLIIAAFLVFVVWLLAESRFPQPRGRKLGGDFTNNRPLVELNIDGTTFPEDPTSVDD